MDPNSNTDKCYPCWMHDPQSCGVYPYKEDSTTVAKQPASSQNARLSGETGSKSVVADNISSTPDLHYQCQCVGCPNWNLLATRACKDCFTRECCEFGCGAFGCRWYLISCCSDDDYQEKRHFYCDQHKPKVADIPHLVDHHDDLGQPKLDVKIHFSYKINQIV